MRYKNNIVFLILIICFLIQISTAGENEYGIVKAWCDNQPATVEGIKLKINEPVEIKVEVTSKIDGFIDLKIKEPGVTDAFSVISGPSKIGEWMTEENVKSGWSKNYTWIITPTGDWTSGTAPVNILVYFYKEIDDDLSIQFTIAHAYILDEQYSGSSSSHTTTDPSSTDQSQSNSSPSFGIIMALLSVALVVMWRQKIY
jgi:sarcinarray family protein